MNPKRGAFIVCNNGLGHFTRVTRVISLLIKNNRDIRIDLYCAKRHFDIKSDDPLVADLMISDRVNIHYTAPNVYWLNDEPVTALKYDESIYETSEIQSADFVISDNITEILNYRSDAILMGSFLWSEIYQYHFADNDFAKKFIEQEVELLEKHKPTVICLRDFAMNYISKYASPYPIDFILDEKFVKQKKEKVNSVLVSPGGTETTVSLTVEVVKALKAFNLDVFVPNRLKNKYPEYAKSFDYSTNSFKNLDIIVARAGIGTITDSIKYNIPIVCIGGDDNYEIQFNSNKVDKLGYGINAKNNITEALDAIKSLTRIENYTVTQSKLRQVKTNGLNQTIKYIESRL